MEAVHAVLLLLAAAHCATAQTVYKVCASERVPSYTCVNLKKGNTEANCLNIADSAECARQLVLGNADLGVLTAEEVLLASKFVVNDDTRIIAEIRHEERLSEPFAFETVAIVRSNYNGLLANLKGKKLCHPGFSDSQLWTNRVLKHFERLVVPRTCNKLVPRIEEEYDNLASFFSQACIPGDWSRNGFRDKQLKAKHPELCALCDNPQRCSYNNHLGSHEAALACLTDRGGDVAYVALQYTKDYFGLGDRKQRANPEDYRYLCPNGTMEVIKNNARPCTWLRQPWNVVVARKDKATILQNKLKTWLPKQTMAAFLRSSKDTWQGALAQILFSESNHFVLVDPPVDSTVLSTYMARGRNETVTPPPSEGQQCRPSVRWCVSTPLEVNKCEVLKQGAFTFGLEPSIQCVTGASMWDCMAAVRNMTADILAIDSEYSHLARKTFGLAGLIYQDSDNDRAYKVVAVVRADSGIMQLSDLKKKSACFPEYGGLAWTAWVDAARSRKLLPRKCPSSVAAASYLYRACAPGADDNIHHPDGDANTRTALCALCPDNNNNSNKKDNVNTNKCAANSLTNGYFADQGAMRCLNDKRGDVAVIDLRAITEIDDSGIVKVNADYREDEYRVLCRNGSASTRLGLLVDSKCALSTGVVGEVVSRGPDEILSKDAALLLMELEYWFGFGAKHYESALNMFGQFRGTEDVIFKRAAVGFISIFDKENVLAREFSSLMDRNQGCNLEGGSAALSAVPVLVVGLVAAVAAVRRL